MRIVLKPCILSKQRFGGAVITARDGSGPAGIFPFVLSLTISETSILRITETAVGEGGAVEWYRAGGAAAEGTRLVA